MLTSESLSKIAPALISASRDLKAVGKDKVNPAYKSKFASLDAIIDSVRPVLAEHRLALFQSAEEPVFIEGTLRAFTVVTRLIHESGEWMESSMVVPVTKADAQGAGGSLTYARRYSISALLTLSVDEDDDGNAASKQPAVRATRPAAPLAAAKPTTDPKNASDPYDAPLASGKPEDRRVRGQRLADMGKDQLEALQTWAKEKGYMPLARDVNSALINIVLGTTDDAKVARLKADDNKPDGLPFK